MKRRENMSGESSSDDPPESLPSWLRKRWPILAYAAMMAGGALLNFSKLFVVGKLLEQSDWGLYAYTLTVIQYSVPIATLGVLEGLSRRVPLLLGQGNKDRAHRLRDRCLGNVLVVCVCAFSVIVLGATVGAVALGRPLPWIVVLATLDAAAYVLFSFVLRDVRAHLRNLAFGGLIFARGGLDICMVLLVAPHFGVRGVLAGECVNLALLSAFALLFLIERPRLAFGWRDADVRGACRDGFLIGLGGMLANTALMGDRLLLGAVLDKSVFAIYAMHTLVVLAALNFKNILVQYIQPRVLHMAGRSASYGEIHRYLFRVATVLGGLALLGAPVLWIAFEYACQVFYPDYQIDFVLFCIIVVGASVEVANIFEIGLIATGGLWSIIRIRLVGGVAVGVALVVLLLTSRDLRHYAMVFTGGRILFVIVCAWAASPRRVESQTSAANDENPAESAAVSSRAA